MTHKEKVHKFYYGLGQRTYRKLPSVRGISKDYRKWEVFSEAPNFKLQVKQLKMDEADLASFRQGFEDASKEK